MLRTKIHKTGPVWPIFKKYQLPNSAVRANFHQWRNQVRRHKQILALHNYTTIELKHFDWMPKITWLPWTNQSALFQHNFVKTMAPWFNLCIFYCRYSALGRIARFYITKIKSWSVWPDWAIYWTLGKFLKPLATINLPKSPTFLDNFCKVVNFYHFSSEINFGQLL